MSTEAPARYYVKVFVEDGQPFTQVLLPGEVGVTITAAMRNGMTHGTVTHKYRIPHTEIQASEVYCWEKV